MHAGLLFGPCLLNPTRLVYADALHAGHFLRLRLLYPSLLCRRRLLHAGLLTNIKALHAGLLFGPCLLNSAGFVYADALSSSKLACAGFLYARRFRHANPLSAAKFSSLRLLARKVSGAVLAKHLSGLFKRLLRPRSLDIRQPIQQIALRHTFLHGLSRTAKGSGLYCARGSARGLLLCLSPCIGLLPSDYGLHER